MRHIGHLHLTNLGTRPPRAPANTLRTMRRSVAKRAITRGSRHDVHHVPAGKFRQKQPHKRNTQGRGNQRADERTCEIYERTDRLLVAQSLDRGDHKARHRGKAARESHAKALAGHLAYTLANPRRGSHVFGQHGQQEACEYVRNECAQVEHGIGNRHQRIHDVPKADTEKTTYENHEVDQAVGQRIEPCLHTLRGGQWNLRRIRLAALTASGAEHAFLQPLEFQSISELI